MAKYLHLFDTVAEFEAAYGSTKDRVEFRLFGTNPEDAWFSYSYTSGGEDVYSNDDLGNASLSEGTAPQVGNTAWYWNAEQDREIVEVRTFPAQYVEPWVSYTEENEHVDYNKPPFSNEVKALLAGLPNSSKIVGVMPEFPSSFRGQGGSSAYDQYYVNTYFMVDECPGWGWTTPGQLTDAWLKEMIESVDWEHCYYWYWGDDHTTYPFRILYDTEVPIHDPVTQQDNVFSFAVKYENGELSINNNYTIYNGDAIDVKTENNDVFHTWRYNEY